MTSEDIKHLQVIKEYLSGIRGCEFEGMARQEMPWLVEKLESLAEPQGGKFSLLRLNPEATGNCEPQGGREAHVAPRNKTAEGPATEASSSSASGLLASPRCPKCKGHQITIYFNHTETGSIAQGHCWNCGSYGWSSQFFPASLGREPDGYAYRYPCTLLEGKQGSVIRFSNGQEINGTRPIESIPYFFGKPAPSPESRREMAKRAAIAISSEEMKLNKAITVSRMAALIEEELSR